ncbi:MAG: response regulator [Firmicutes bacterium]|nr:response regulator [Bacillota bacterium]
MRQMMLLMIEDEAAYRQDFKEYISALSPTLGYPISFYVAEGESEGLELVQKLPFDVIILDLELHYSDGDGLTFLKKLIRLNLPDKPYIVVTTFNRSPLAREGARENGADYVFWKKKQDYSPRLVMEHVCAFYEYKISARPSEPAKIKMVSLEDDLKMRIDKIGFTDEMLGKRYVIDAITIVAKSSDPDINLHRDVFPIIARNYKKSVGSVNRAIETAINKAWSITDADTLAESYPLVVSGSKGAPTNKEFIFHFAQQMKDAGRA